MSTRALHIIELVKTLPPPEQQEIAAALNQAVQSHPKAPPPLFPRDAKGNPYDPDGIPDDDPFFKILAEDEERRHAEAGPPAPDFD